jgi:hypothetical protein
LDANKCSINFVNKIKEMADDDDSGLPGQDIESGPAPPDSYRMREARRISPYDTLSGLGRVAAQEDSQNFVFLGPNGEVYRLQENEFRHETIVRFHGFGENLQYVTVNWLWCGAITVDETFRYNWTPLRPWHPVIVYNAEIAAPLRFAIKAVVRWWGRHLCYFLLHNGALYKGDLPHPTPEVRRDEVQIRVRLIGEAPPAEMILNSRDSGEMMILGLDRRSLYICSGLHSDDEDEFIQVPIPDDCRGNIVQIAGSNQSYGFITDEGLVFTMGRNGSFNLGHGHNAEEIPEPLAIPGVDTAVGLGICNTHIAIVLRNGSVVVAGTNGVWTTGMVAGGAPRAQFIQNLTPFPNITDAKAVYCKPLSTTIIHQDGRMTLFRRSPLFERNQVFTIPPEDAPVDGAGHLHYTASDVNKMRSLFLGYK